MYPTITIGSRQKEVTTLKQLLRSQGLWKGSDSDAFGSETDAAVRYFQGTHLGPDGKFLHTDGIVGPDTWWALLSPGGPAQKSGIKPVPPSGNALGLDDFGMRYGLFDMERQEFIKILFQQYALGTKEIPDGSNTGGEVTKFLADFGPVPWCALFVSWCFKQATGRYPFGKVQAHVQTEWSIAKAVKRTYLKGSKVPTPGDCAIWAFAKGAGHIAPVVAVSADGSQFNTIAGNEGNRVKLGHRITDEESSLVGFLNLFDDAPNPLFHRALLAKGDSTRLTSVASR